MLWTCFVSESARRRLFFALWPDAALRGRLAELQGVCGVASGRPVAVESLHITLVFLGDVPGDRVACIGQAASSVRASGFDLTLDCLGYWRRPQVVWAGARECPSALDALVQSLQSALQACGHAPDSRPYAVHLTLWRKVQRRPPLRPGESLHWPVRAFSLVESHLEPAGARYETLQFWPLD